MRGTSRATAMVTSKTVTRRMMIKILLPFRLILIVPLITKQQHHLFVLGDGDVVSKNVNVDGKKQADRKAQVDSSSCSVHIGERQDGESQHHRRMVNVENLLPSCKQSSVITIDIPHDGIKRSFIKSGFSEGPMMFSPSSSSTSSSSFYSSSSFNYWVGEDPNDGSIFNYVQDDNSGQFSGSMVDLTEHNVIQFHSRNGLYVATITASSDFPPEGDHERDHDEEDRHNLRGVLHGVDRKLKSSGRKDSSANDNNGNDSKHQSIEIDDATNKNISTMPSSTRSTSITATDTKSSLPPYAHYENYQGNRKLYDDSGGNLDIMVVWTASAECKAYGQSAGCELTEQSEANMMALINLAVQETNMAYQTSGVDTELLLVHAYRHPTYLESSFRTSLSDVRFGKMSGVHLNRKRYGADIVALIIDNADYCGLAYVGPSNSLMYSVTAWNCATGYYSFGHEVAHNLGCYHDRGTSDKCNNIGYNYGYRDPNATFRTILAYDCVAGQCDNNIGRRCSRIPRFSNPHHTYDGLPLGNSTIDNARAINDVREVVAGYYTHVSKMPTMSPAPSTSPRCGHELDVTVTIISDYYPNETTWTIQNASGTVITSDGGNIVDRFTRYIEEVCLDSSECYTFTIYDSFGDGISTPFSLIVDDEVKLTNPNRVKFRSKSARFGECSPTVSPTKAPTSTPTASPTKAPTSVPSGKPSVICTENELDVTISITSDYYPSENSWTIQNGAGTIVKSDGGNIIYGFTEYIEHVCLNSSECFTFTINDSFEDGILSPFSLIVDGEMKLSNPYTLFDSLSARFGECSPTFSPTKASTKAPTPTPSSSPSVACTANELDVTVSITSNYHPNEITWTIQNDSGTVVTSDEGNIVDRFTRYIQDICLESTECFTFTIYDSFGDGISTPFSLIVDDEVKLSNPNTPFRSLNVEFGQCVTVSPSFAPALPTPAPVRSTPAPVSVVKPCKDSSERFKVTWKGNVITRDCIWISNRATIQRCNIEGVKEACPLACGICS